MRILTMKSGREIECYSCGEAGGTLSITLGTPCSLLDGLMLFSDPQEISTLTCDYGSDIVESYQGYIRPVYALLNLYDNRVTIGLRKEA